MSKSFIVTKDGKTSVSTGELFSVWQTGNDRKAAEVVAGLHEAIERLKTEHVEQFERSLER